MKKLKKHLLLLCTCLALFSFSHTEKTGNTASDKPNNQSKKEYDVAAYFWPAYHDEPRIRRFFKGDEGEWEIIRNAKSKFEGHQQPRIPLWGYEDESDPKVMQKKIDAAVDHGVNVFIIDWYWYENQPFLEKTINEGFLKAPNVDKIKFYLMWANHDATTTWSLEESHERKTVWPGKVDFDTFKTVVQRVIKKYITHPSYYKIDGKPVFCIYELHTLMEGLGGIDQTKEALQYFRNEVKRAGFPDLHLQVTIRNQMLENITGIPGDNARTKAAQVKNLGFSSITHYQWIHVSGAGTDYVSWGMKAVKQWPELQKEFGLPYFPHVAVGWDNNSRFKEHIKRDIIYNSTTASFEAFLYKAKAYVDNNPEQPPLITINSWNEWSEGSYLEPDMRHSYGYLEAVRKVFGEHK